MNTAPDAVLRQAWLGLGGNVGDPVANMRAALLALSTTPGVGLVGVSRLYKTPPWGKTDQDWFFNACAVIATDLSPHALLDLCLSIERSLKRVRTERWGPRTIDIDVLSIDGVRLEDERLSLPHPRMTERAFVMVPLADLVPEASVAGRTVRDWAETSDRAGIEIASDRADWWRG